MKQQTIGSIAKLAEGKLLNPEKADMPIGRLSTDTRTLAPGDIYIPIIGERWDGHDFINEAFEKGAAACFLAEDHPAQPEGTYIEVEDTLKAMQTAARNYRKEVDPKVFAITGSNGKTTTKDILYSLFKEKYAAKKTVGNLNNHIGVPKTLLDLDEDTEYAIVEMGMDDFGEISELVTLALPDVAIITNVGDVHLEQLKTRENVAKAKLEILENMDSDKLFLYNYDDAILRKEVQSREIIPQVVTFGQDPESDVVLSLVRSDEQGTTFTLNGEPYHVNLLGAYQMYNAAAAIIVAKRFGLSEDEIKRGLMVEATGMRTEMLHLAGFDILVDCYKSNPQSLTEAIHTAQFLTGYRRKIAILGDMLELGKDEKAIHYECGKELSPDVFDYVLFYGPLSRYMILGAKENFPEGRLFHFEDKPTLVDQAKYLIVRNSLVVVKASRALRLEEVVESIKPIRVN